MNHSNTGNRNVKNLERHKDAASTDASKRREARGLKDSQRAAYKGWGKGKPDCSRRKAQSMMGKGSSKEVKSRQPTLL